jgi:SAM-dependent methyltransferase
VKADDPAFVAAEYATEHGLAARQSIYGHSGRDARDVVLDELRAIGPAARVLEVGCGWGELAARIEEELGCVVVALDLSARMVELARGRGVDAYVTDVQEIPFPDGGFDAVVAAWMLYTSRISSVAFPRLHASFGLAVHSSRSRMVPVTSTMCGISSDATSRVVV